MFYATMPSGVLLSGRWTPTKECPFRSPDTDSDISPSRRPESTRAPLRYTLIFVFELSFRRHHIAAYATFRRVAGAGWAMPSQREMVTGAGCQSPNWRSNAGRSLRKLPDQGRARLDRPFGASTLGNREGSSGTSRLDQHRQVKRASPVNPKSLGKHRGAMPASFR